MTPDYLNNIPDPTTNVREMVRDGVSHLSDLQKAAKDRTDDLAAAESRRVDEKIAAETRRVDELASQRSWYEEKLSVAEAGRLNANRTMDENSRTVDREKVAAQAALLASDVKSTAETARQLVAQTKEEQTKNLDQRINPILEKIALLEQAQFTGVGERRIADPAQMKMEEDVRELLSRGENARGRAGLSQPMLLTIVGAVAAFASWAIQQAIR